MSITARLIQHYQVELTNGRHIYHADEPLSSNGEDTGPNPYDYLLGGLAACKIITMQMYAQRKGWIIDALELRLSHRKVDAAECQECVTETGKVDIIEVEMTFGPQMTPEQIERLTQISERCPVHRTLTSETVIRTRAVP